MQGYVYKVYLFLYFMLEYRNRFSVRRYFYVMLLLIYSHMCNLLTLYESTCKGLLNVEVGSKRVWQQLGPWALRALWGTMGKYTNKKKHPYKTYIEFFFVGIQISATLRSNMMLFVIWRYELKYYYHTCIYTIVSTATNNDNLPLVFVIKLMPEFLVNLVIQSELKLY